jgi:hypothetical protein
MLAVLPQHKWRDSPATEFLPVNRSIKIGFSGFECDAVLVSGPQSQRRIVLNLSVRGFDDKRFEMGHYGIA